MDNYPACFLSKWIWNDATKSLSLRKTCQVKIKAARRRLSSIAFEKLMAKKGGRYAHVVSLRIKFDDSAEPSKLSYFRLNYRRQGPKSSTLDVVTLEDIKNVAIFQAGELPGYFLDFFNQPPVNNLMRTLILYFYFFLQGYGEIQKYYKNVKTFPKMEHTVTPRLRKILDDLKDLKTLVAREYAIVIMSKGDMQQFHHRFCHKGGPNRIYRSSQSFYIRDQWIYESLYQMMARVVWIANERHSLSLIEIELNQLFRSTRFNMIVHRIMNASERFQGSNIKVNEKGSVEPANLFMYENGSPLVTMPFKGKTKTNIQWKNSPLIDQLLHDDEIDPCLLEVGTDELTQVDERLAFLEEAIYASEEDLSAKNMCIGILGRRRDEFNLILEELGDENSTDSKTTIFSDKKRDTKRDILGIMKIPPREKKS